MRYSGLQPGDMFNTIFSRYVKQLDGSVMIVTGKHAGETVGFNDDGDVIPLYAASKRVSLLSIIEAAEELSSATWSNDDPGTVRPLLENLDSLIGSAKKGMQ